MSFRISGIHSKQILGGPRKMELRFLKSLAGAVSLFITATTITTLIASGQTALPQDNKKAYVRTGQEATITGLIHFEGEAPATYRINMTQDAVCDKINRRPIVDWVIITNGKLANVFVYVKEGRALENFEFEAPSAPVSLQYKGCRYVPHILGIQTQQTLRIINSDPTTHNTHPLPKLGGNLEWNESQRPGSAPIERRFDRPEMFIPIRDNQHPWEKAYVGVLSHPFYAVSGRDGSFRIEGLPPGDYTIVAWHERFGEKTVSLTIVPYETRMLDFTFDSQEQ